MVCTEAPGHFTYLLVELTYSSLPLAFHTVIRSKDRQSMGWESWECGRNTLSFNRLWNLLFSPDISNLCTSHVWETAFDFDDKLLKYPLGAGVRSCTSSINCDVQGEHPSAVWPGAEKAANIVVLFPVYSSFRCKIPQGNPLPDMLPYSLQRTRTIFFLVQVHFLLICLFVYVFIL